MCGFCFLAANLSKNPSLSLPRYISNDLLAWLQTSLTCVFSPFPSVLLLVTCSPNIELTYFVHVLVRSRHNYELRCCGVTELVFNHCIQLRVHPDGCICVTFTDLANLLVGIIVRFTLIFYGNFDTILQRPILA